MSDTYAITNYAHAETVISAWWQANKPTKPYTIEIRGTFYMRARLAKEGRRVVLADWQRVLGCWFREGAYSVPLTDNPKYEATEDILLFFPVASCEIRLTQ